MITNLLEKQTRMTYMKQNAPSIYEPYKMKQVFKLKDKLQKLRDTYKNEKDEESRSKITREAHIITEEMKVYV